jgi:hypothetical protein
LKGRFAIALYVVAVKLRGGGRRQRGQHDFFSADFRAYIHPPFVQGVSVAPERAFLENNRIFMACSDWKFLHGALAEGGQ